LHLPSVTDLWPGAEWPEREVFDMLGVRFDGHPDLRRILLWESYPAHPLRKDYPLRGRGERDNFRVIGRDSA
jgi:NADH-quinone oxidoreductase subunit C